MSKGPDSLIVMFTLDRGKMFVIKYGAYSKISHK